MSLFHRMMLRRLGVAQTHPVSIRRNLKVIMLDGAELLTDLYLGNAAAAPVILVRSPYGRSAFFAAMNAYPLAAQGFNVVMQSCRGTFGSTGKFDPHHDEQRDGLETIEWIKAQAWCEGSIATFGMSYLGYTQWALAASAGPEVKAMAMQATLADFSRMTYSGDSFALETELGWTQMMTTMRQQGYRLLPLILSRMLGLGKIRREQWRLLPLADMDQKVLGERVGFWQDWLEHSSAGDPWWAPMNFHRSIGEIKRPISMVAGWFDIFLPWQLQDFAALRRNGSESRITIGPWRHTDSDLMRAGVSDGIDWFNRHLLGKDSASNPWTVKLYVVGADEWRFFDEWPPRGSVTEHWYLQPQRKLLERAAADSEPDQYRYDPADPTPSMGGPALDSAPFSVDNTELERRSDVITYTSEPLPQQRDLIGAVAAELYVSSSAASADFFLRLCDVDAQGISKNICDGLQRVRIDAPNVPQQVRVDLWPTAYRFARGHRLRVQISSGAFPRWARNLGGTETLGQATEARSATQAIHHSSIYPSAVLLPFTPAPSK
jgi:hypothetical protein